MSDRLWILSLFGWTVPRAARSLGSRRRLALELLEDRQAPATLTVNSAADTAHATDPYLSLREALAIFNSPTLPSGLSTQIHAQISGTLHAGGADTIRFNSGVTTITLSGTQLHLSLPSATAQVTIDGGAGVTVDGNHASRVLQLDHGVQATLAHLTITHGSATGSIYGGGIYNSGTLTVISSTVSVNTSTGTLRGHGGGIYNTGTLTVTSSTLSGNSSSDIGQNSNGAGIYNDTGGSVTVTSSTLSANSASSFGGGIYNGTGGTLTVTSSTFSANSGFGGGIESFGTATVTNSTFSANSGSGIGNAASGTLTVTGSTLSANTLTGRDQGGGIDNAGMLTVTNSTLSANSAYDGGGIYNGLGTLTVTNSTLYGNSASDAAGGLDAAAGVVDLRNTIVAGNVAPSGSDIYGTVSSTSAYNLVGVGTGLSGISNGLGGNLVGTAGNPIDPRLGPLASNGGPTRTQAVLADSPARGAGSLAYATATDQRGSPRTVGGEIDLGAYQTQTGVAGPRAVVSDPDNVVDPPVDHVRLTFNHPINPASVTTAAFSLTGPGGAVPVTGVTAVGSSGGQQFDIGFPAQAAPGGYALAVGTGIQDIHGGALAGPYTARFTVFGPGSVLTVNSTADTAHSTDPYLTLREALAIVNSPTLPSGLSPQILAQIQGTLHANGSDTIVFDPAHVTGPIVLAGSQLEVSLSDSKARVTIDGGAGVTVDGNNASRVLQVDGGVQAVLAHLTITHGRSPSGLGIGAGEGGGIYDFWGTLTVTGSTLSANSSTSSGAGLSNIGGTVTVSNSTLSSNTAGGEVGNAYGGGISNAGTLTVNNSVLSSNSSGPYGGGIYNSGTLTVTGSTITGNRTELVSVRVGAGAGIYNFGTATLRDTSITSNSAFSSAGGIDTGRGSMTVTNCTIASNSSLQSGGISNSATLTLTNSTIYANRATANGGGGFSGRGGGISNNGTLTVQSCTVFANSAGSSDGGIHETSSSASLTLNNTIVSGNFNGDLGGSYTGTYNLVGVASPGVATLANNGGPTQTCALLPGSPAIGTGDPALAGTLDQRGVPRHSTPCIGAYEVTAPVVTTLADSGVGSLRTALAQALAGDVITFAPALQGTITLTSGELQAQQNLTIAGPGAGVISVSGGGASRVLEVFAGATVSVSGLTITGGSIDTGGGGIRNAGTLTLTDCQITNNQAAVSLSGTGTENVSVQGGGIYTTGSLTLLRCTISGNSALLTAGNVFYAQANGGGLYTSGGTVGLTNCTVSSNSASAMSTGGSGLVFAYGGGLTCDNGTLTLAGCTVSGNTAMGGNAAGYGGGLHSYQSTVNLGNCTIANNTASSAGDAGLGGGISDLDSSLTLTSCTVTGNAANSLNSTGSGGGLFYNSGAGFVQVLNTIVAGNSSGTDSPDISGTCTSLGSNLIGITDGSTGWGGSDLTGTASSPLDPMLGTLGSYGGPTQTIPLLAGSPALDAGDPGQLGSANQRGVVRTGGVNIGAFQASAASFVLSAPSTATSGVPFDVSVAVYDIFGQLAVGYLGTIHFSSTDNDPNVVLPADYTFGIGDGGAVTFSGGVTLITPGSQTLTVNDFANGISASVIVTL